MSSSEPPEHIIFERLADRLGPPLPQDDRSLFQRYVGVHQTVLDNFDDDIQAVLESQQLATATGRDLDLIGRRYGELGKRRGRGDDVYRRFLGSLVSAFGGRGTESDIRFAIAAGVLADPDEDVTLAGDEAALEYTVELTDWQPHRTGLIDELADYADAPVVSRVDPISYVCEPAPVSVGLGEAGGRVAIEAPPAAVNVEPGEASSTTEYVDGWDGGFRWDSGDRWDIPDADQTTISAIPRFQTTTISSGERAEADAVYDHDGTLNHDGTIDQS